ncbi:MAG: hypothetical protein H0T89_31335 [Deltaproteobacteria bacterium]|nr:hypothetical protein [Deltaproteobacteria bacterium]MDQ3298126.1 hypothetical protein [Myxococcota bacterium]
MARDDDARDSAADAPLDVVVGVGVTPDRAGLQVVRLRDVAPDVPGGGNAEARRVIELGEMRPSIPDTALPVGAELVRLKQRRGDGPAWDVEVVVPRQLSGPSQVATANYRANWSSTFDDDDAN